MVSTLAHLSPWLYTVSMGGNPADHTSNHMNTSTTVAYPDVDAAAHVWDNTEGSLSWDQLNILSYCRHAKRIEASDDHSLSYKVSYLKAAIDLIEDSVKAQAQR
jgi:hypothetical protein